MFSLPRFIRAVKAALQEESMLPMDVRRLDLHAGDTVIIRCTTDVSSERMGGILDSWNKQFPGVKAVIVDQYLDISIVGRSLTTSARV